MAEEYSEIWLTVHCSSDPRSFQDAINDAWNEILEKYEDQGVVNDTGSMVGVGDVDLNPQIEDSTVSFGLGSHASDGEPHYEEQYQAMGEMIWRMQEAMKDWNMRIEIEKTGASG